MGAPGTHIVGAMFVTRANRDTMMMCAHFLPLVQFRGLLGSCGPSQSTMLASCASDFVGLPTVSTCEIGAT